jgi:release factor glutamine methyltransferase
MLVRELLRSGIALLQKAGVDTPDIDTELLLGYCLDKSRTELYLAANEPVTGGAEQQFRALLSRRQKREPLAYILGTQEFWSLDFFVSPAVLIPRPETELLLEKAIAMFTTSPVGKGLIVDLCCGSGAIAVVLAKELGRPVLAIDISMDAIHIARKNSERHGVSHLVSFLHSDLLSAIVPRPVLSFVVSNPPYVSREEMVQGLQPEVDLFEPHLALDGGRKGLEVIRLIHEQLTTRFLPEGKLFMEIGTEQGEAVLDIFGVKVKKDVSFIDLSIHEDYAGHDRILYAKTQASD